MPKLKKKNTVQRAKKSVKKRKKPVKKVLRKKSVKAKKKITVKKKPVAKKLRKTKKVVSRKKTTVKKSAKPKLKKVNFKSQLTGEEAFGTTPFRAKIKVVGVGGGGGSIVAEIGKSLEKAAFAVADTDLRALKKRPGIKNIWFGEELTRGLGTGLNVPLAMTAAENAKEKMASVVKDQDIIIFIASLGGGVGSGATQIFAKAARESGGITLGIFTMPFKFEGAQKQKAARDALKSLRHLLNVSLVIPNERIFKIIDETTAITDAFSLVNKNLVDSLESLIDLISSAGIINIDFADLKTILSGIGSTAFLNTVEAAGKDRAQKICETLLVNPLLQGNTVEAEKILLHIAGANALSMLEVEKISRHVSEANPKAKVIFGISKNNKLKNKIKATVLITGNQEKEVIEKKLVPAEEVIPLKVLKAEEQTPEPVVVLKPVEKLVPVAKKKVKKKKVKVAKKSQKKKEEISIIPIFQPQVATTASTAERKLDIVETSSRNVKPTIRRSAMDIKKSDEAEEKRRREQEQEWEIPAFLRFKNKN